MAIDFNQLRGYLDFSIGGNTGEQYLIALLVLFSSWIVLKIFKNVILKKLEKLSRRTKTQLDNIIIRSMDSIHWPFYMLLSLYISLFFVVVPPLVSKVADYVLIIMLTYYAVRFLQAMIRFFSDGIIKKHEKEEKEHDASMVRLLSTIFKLSLWLIAFVFLLSNMGYNISSLIAGLGIGGIAIALALQNILGDMFSAFSIYFDKPFKVGDMICVGADRGTVKHIGIKSTRLKTLQGEELVISNKELTSTRIQNFKKMEKRRIVFGFGVTYQTPVKKMKKIPEMVLKIIEKEKLAEPDRIHFKEFADSSLNFEVVYYMKVSNYTKKMDTQQSINLAIMEKFEKEKIEMAYPTQTIFLEK